MYFILKTPYYFHSVEGKLDKKEQPIQNAKPTIYEVFKKVSDDFTF